MHTNGPKEDPLVELGYDHRDVNYKALIKAVIAFLSFGVGAAIVGAIIYTNRFAIFKLQEPRPGINAELSRRVAATGTPLLQDNVASKVDIMTLRQKETKRMTSTGYTDETRRYVHIPVDRAMEMIAQRGVGSKSAATGSTEPVTIGGTPGTPTPGEGGGSTIPAAPLPESTSGGATTSGAQGQ